MRNGIPQGLPDGDVSGVFRSPCASNQMTARRPRRRERRERAHMRAATAAQHERAGRAARRRATASARRACRPRSRPPRGQGELVHPRLRHRLAALTPGSRNANKAGGELPAARVTLVLRPERDRGQGPAVRAAAAEARHARTQPRAGRRGRACLGRQTCRPARRAGSLRSGSRRRPRACRASSPRCRKA